MRLLPLLGLAGLAAASPTPIDIDARALRPQGLTVFAQDGFDGPGYAVDANHCCVKLEKPAYKNVHAYQVTDLVCNFMAEDRCNGRAVLTTDARGTMIKGEVDTADMDKIAAVYCGERTSAIDAPLTEKRGAEFGGPAGGIHACTRGYCIYPQSTDNKCVAFERSLLRHVESIWQLEGSVCTYFSTQDCASGSALITIDSSVGDYNPYLGPLQEELAGFYCSVIPTSSARSVPVEARAVYPGPGVVKACDHFGGSVRCEEARSINDACVTLSFAGNIDKVLQFKGAICLYFENRNCARTGTMVTVDSIKKDYYLSLAGNWGKRMKAFECKLSPNGHGYNQGPGSPGGSNEKYANDIVAFQESAIISLQARGEEHSATIESRSGKPGLIKTCRDYDGGEGCVWQKSPANECVQLVKAGHIKSLVQFEGAVCYYFAASDCTGFVWILDSTKGDNYPLLENDAGKKMSPFRCKPGRKSLKNEEGPEGPGGKQLLRARADDIAAFQESEITSLEAHDGDPEIDYRGFIRFCKTEVGCASVFALNACRTFEGPYHHGIDRVYQEAGAICKYFKEDCSEPSAAVVIDSRAGLYIGDLGGHGHELEQVLCRLEPWAAKGDEKAGINIIVKTEAPKAEHPAEKRDAIDVATSPTTIDRTSQPGDVTICRGEYFRGVCNIFNAMNRCVALSKEVQRHGRSIKQAKGALCTFYEARNGKYCGKDIGHLIFQGERNKDIEWNIVGPEYADYVTSVECQPFDSALQIPEEVPEVFLDEQDAVQISMEKRDVVAGPHAASTQELEPGYIAVCTKKDLIDCGGFRTMDRCTELSKTDGTRKNVSFLQQGKGATCYYYADEQDHSTVRLKLDSPLWDLTWEKVPQADSESITRVCCSPLPYQKVGAPAEQPGNSASSLMPRSNVHVQRELGNPGDVKSCVRGVWQSCQRLEAMGQCRQMTYSTSLSANQIWQVAGAICDYYSIAESGCHGDRYSLVTTKSEWTVDTDNWPFLPRWVQCFVPNSAEAHKAMQIDGAEVHSPEDTPTSSLSQRDMWTGWVRVNSQEELSGKSQDLNIGTDVEACGHLVESVLWNVQSIYQWEGTMCSFWQYDCYHGTTPLFVMDARGHTLFLSQIPEYFGPNRHLVGTISCVGGAAADAYFEGLDKSNLIIIGGEHATVDMSTFDVGSPDVAPPQAATIASVNTRDAAPAINTNNPVQPLKICHDVNLGGTCVVYTPPGCQNHPFVDHSVKSFELIKGWQCVVWPGQCITKNGEPEFIDASMHPVQVIEVTYDFGSVECVEFEPDVARREANVPAAEQVQELATREYDSPPTGIDNKVHLYSGANMTGISYTVPNGTWDDCQNLPPNMTVVKSFTLKEATWCRMYPERDCPNGETLFDFTDVDATNGPQQESNFLGNIQSVRCGQTHPDGPPGLVTSCDEVYFKSCTDVRVDAMGRCVTLSSKSGGPASIKVTPNADCTFFADANCSSEHGMGLSARQRTSETADLNAWKWTYNSVRCEAT